MKISYKCLSFCLTLSVVLFICACNVYALVRQEAATLIVPAFTAYAEPDPYGMDFSKDGITGWKNQTNSISWYGFFKNTGSLRVGIKFHLSEGVKWSSRISVDNQVLTKACSGSGEKTQKLDFGTLKIHSAGYHRVTLGSYSDPNVSKPDIISLELTGLPCNDSHFNMDERRNASSVHLSYPTPVKQNITGFYNEIMVKKAPLWTYYMACGFKRGYFGIQVNSPTERRVIFSVWDSGNEAVDRSKVSAKDRVELIAKGKNVYTDSFGNEGTGGHSHLIYPWKVGTKYRFLVTAKPAGFYTTYSGYFYFTEKKKWGLIASFKAPNDGSYLSGLYSFNENFDGANGQVKRLASFENQWIVTDNQKLIELTNAKFSHDPTGKIQRKDYDASVKDAQFSLSNGGFQSGNIWYGDVLHRPASKHPPSDVISISASY